MLQESASEMPSSSSASAWESMASWFTPTVLFLLLNVMIATIAFTSSEDAKKQRRNRRGAAEDGSQPSIVRIIKSISFQQCYSDQSQQRMNTSGGGDSEDAAMLFGGGIESHADYFFRHPPAGSSQEGVEIRSGADADSEENGAADADEAPMIEENGNGGIDEVFAHLTAGNRFGRSRSETEPAAAEVPAEKMRKSASAGSEIRNRRDEDEAGEARRPTAREKRSSRSADGDEGVDAKADVFINKFKHQLKLQRLDSIVRSKDGR